MKLSGITLIAGMAVGAIVATPVGAQERVSERHVEVQRTVTNHTDNGWHHQVRRHKVCRTHWYHHRKVTRCTWRRWG